MKKLKYIFLATLAITSLSATAQNKLAGELSLKDLEAAMKTDQRLIVMQFSTDWCVYCKIQDRRLFKNKEIKSFLEEKTYYINVNAESNETVTFNKTTYHPSQYENGLHELTQAITGEHQQATFPMWVIFNKNYEIIYRHSGLVKTRELSEVLKNLLLEE